MKAIAKVTAHMADDPTDIWIVKGKTYDLARVIHEGEDLYHFIDEQGDSHHLEIGYFDRYFEVVKEQTKIKVLNLNDESEFENIVNAYLEEGWKISSTSCGFLNSELHDFSTSFHAILVKGEI